MLPTRVVSFPGVGMTCCRCNRTGCCQNGSCVKRGQPCQNYLQQWLGTVLIPFRLLGEQSKGRALQLDDLIDTGNGQMWGTSLMINILLVNVHTLKQSSTMTLTMYILFCLNLWMQSWSDLLHYTPVEQPDLQVSMHLDGEGYVPPSNRHPWSFAILWP